MLERCGIRELGLEDCRNFSGQLWGEHLDNLPEQLVIQTRIVVHNPVPHGRDALPQNLAMASCRANYSRKTSLIKVW